MDSLIVNNLTEISKIALFFFVFACSFFDGMNASVHESKCFDLVFAERTRNVCITKYACLYKLSNGIMVMTPK